MPPHPEPPPRARRLVPPCATAALAALLAACPDGGGGGGTAGTATTGGAATAGTTATAGTATAGTTGGGGLDPCLPDPFEPDDDPASAPAVGFADDGAVESRTLCAGDVDHVWVILDAPGYVGVDAVRPLAADGQATAPGTLHLTLEDAAGTVLAAAGDATARAFNPIHRRLPAGTYRLTVTHLDPNAPIPLAYTLRWTLLPEG